MLENRIWNAQLPTERVDGGVAMVDCWRLCLLLYCARVLHRDHDQGLSHTLATDILLVLQKIPQNSALEKQILLPVILAACEMEVGYYRAVVIEYIERWKRHTGIWIFDSALELIAAVWAAMDAGDQTVWWCDVVPRDAPESYIFG